jgi:hypothetical protein
MDDILTFASDLEDHLGEYMGPLCRVIARVKIHMTGIPADHGFQHCVDVLVLAIGALGETNTIPEQTYHVLLAAILHEADDEKLFPATADYANARQILMDEIGEVPDPVITMISLVSTSKNGMCISGELPGWMYIPSIADGSPPTTSTQSPW